MFQVANKLSDEEYDVLDEQYSPRIKKLMDEFSKDFLNSDYLVFDAYWMMLYSLTTRKEEQTIPIRIDEWIKSKVIFNNLKKANERTVIEGFKPQIDEIKTAEYQDLLVAAYQFYLAFNSGDEAINFTAHDREGNAVNLVDYKGKVIYLEFWATWCMPCIEQFAPLDALQEEFKDNEDIVILAVSIDKNIEAWEKHLDKRQPKTAQVLVNSKELDDYSVSFIPRTIIIDKEFKVVDMHAKAPSDPATKSYLMELVKN
jgi:thiol-disulfide isomerase/thioredoxin